MYLFLKRLFLHACVCDIVCAPQCICSCVGQRPTYWSHSPSTTWVLRTELQLSDLAGKRLPLLSQSCLPRNGSLNEMIKHFFVRNWCMLCDNDNGLLLDWRTHFNLSFTLFVDHRPPCFVRSHYAAYTDHKLLTPLPRWAVRSQVCATRPGSGFVFEK